MVVPLTGLFVWWIAACRVHLRLTHATATGISVALVGVLLAMIVEARQIVLAM